METTDFKNAAELLELCSRHQWMISDVMKQRECDLSEIPMDQICHQMKHVLDIMKQSAAAPLRTPVKSMGGLIGGESRKLELHRNRGTSICGSVLGRGIACAMAVLEVNASMGVIVAAPTAGSAGIVPGLLLALQQEYHISDDRMVDALFNAGAVGYLAMRNATVAGAVGGCQAETGVAAAMAASAAVELMGGEPVQSLSAASTVLMNMLGLVCDPVAGLVEVPCVKRNVVGAVNALSAADMALAGIISQIPVDQVIDAMKEVGDKMDATLRETALGGVAMSPRGQEVSEKMNA